MKADDPRAAAWRALLRRELEDAGVSQSELARRLDRTNAQVNQWLMEGNRHGPPDPDTVFAIEDILGCVDRLSSALGYVRPGSAPETVRAIRRDSALSRAQRQTLLDLYGVMAQERGD